MFRALRTRIHDLWLHILRQHRSPGRVFWAILLGCVVGCTPTFGVQIFLCMGLAWLLRLNLPIVYGAANISIPPMVPLLGWTSIQLGERLLHGTWLSLSRSDFDAAHLPGLLARFFWGWLMGGTLLGSLIGLCAGGLTYLVLRLRTRPEDADAISQAIARAALRYQAAPPRYRHYARWKYRLDPCYRALLAHTPPGATVVDLGCGLAQLGIALLEYDGTARYLGVDWDEAKIRAGQLAQAGDDRLTLVIGDARTLELPTTGAPLVVTLVDVLHYYDQPTQDAILQRAAAALFAANRVPHDLPSRLLIRETDPASQGGAGFTRWAERLMVRLGWNRGPKVWYRPVAELSAQLVTLGFEVTVAKVAATSYPGNVLLCAMTRRAMALRDEHPNNQAEEPA